MNGSGYWSMVILVQSPKDIHSKVVRVEFSLPCGKSPESVLAQPPIQKFHLFRQRDCDEVLKGPVDRKPGEDLVVPLWKYLPSNERSALPFGQVLPCYHSAELPVVPVV
jgi:hypothetical protein